jgi:hypothetical protein
MVPLNYSDRTIVAQGIVNNTLGVIKNRHSGINSLPFAYPDYILRCGGKAKTTSGFDGRYAHFDLLKLNNNLNPSDGPSISQHTANSYIEIMGNCSDGSYPFTDYHDLSQFNSDADNDYFFVDRNLVNL